MDEATLTAILLLSALVTSGCMGGGGGNEGGLNVGPGGKTITVTNFEVQPRDLLSGSNAQINVGIVNTGSKPANVTVGEEGKEILTNYCEGDIFRIQDFNAVSTGSEENEGTYSLRPGGELDLSWNIINIDESVPPYGLRCPLGLQIPFDYGVSAYQQLEVKRDREVQGATSLRSRTSEGPLNINMEVTGSAEAPSFLKGDTMEILLQMENNAPDESSYQGLVDIRKPVIESSERFLINRTSCNLRTETDSGLTRQIKIDRKMRLYEGQSRVVRCRVHLSQSESGTDIVGDSESMDVPSVRGQITSSVNYTYVKDLGETEIEVESRGQ